MAQMTQADSLERLVRETDTNPMVTGVRVFSQYDLRNGVITPMIICQAMSNSNVVYGEPESYVEAFEQYPSAETKTNPGKIIRISHNVEERALEIAEEVKEYHPETPLRVIVYKQDPPHLVEFPRREEGSKGVLGLTRPKEITIFVQYCLVEDKTVKFSEEDMDLNASSFKIQPTILGPGADIERFQSYPPIETWTNPVAVMGIGHRVELRANEIAENASQRSNVRLYLQNPPDILVLNSVRQIKEP